MVSLFFIWNKVNNYALLQKFRLYFRGIYSVSKMLEKIFSPTLQVIEKAKVEYKDFVSKIFEFFCRI